MRWVLGVLALAALLVPHAALGGQAQDVFVPRGPILIDGPLGLSIGGVPNLASGVTGGSGTATDPYRIGGWMFAAGVGSLHTATVIAIEIRNTGNLHVVVEDNLFQSIGYALRVSNANNVIFRENVIEQAFRAVDVREPVRNVQVIDNTFVGDTLLNAPFGDSNLQDLVVRGNLVFSRGQAWPAIQLYEAEALIEGNTITGFPTGIYCWVCDAIIKQNTISGNDFGIWNYSGNCEIDDNVIAENRVGVDSFTPCEGGGNNFENNTEYAYVFDDDDGWFTLHAQDNYWGHVDGPDGDYWDTPGQDITGIDLLEVFPWRTSPNPDAGAP